jgi:starch synthase
VSLRVLFVTAEYEPLVKVGGLADVSASLPRALDALGHDVRVLLPRYGCLKDVEDSATPIISRLPGGGCLRECRGPGGRIVWLVDLPAFRRRRTHPYLRGRNRAYRDDPATWAEFSRVAARLAVDGQGTGWQPDIVHCNEWHSGLAPVWMQLLRAPASSIFTIHNLAHQGLFDAGWLDRLDLPGWLFHPDALEFHGRLSFIKGGLVFADRLTTVSPSYAQEIQTPGFGEGLDGLLRHRQDSLTGILNGIDSDAFNPRTDAALAAPFSSQRLDARARCRLALLDELGLARTNAPVAGFVGRLFPQKGADLILDALDRLLDTGLSLVILGRGDPALERAFRRAGARHPDRVAVRLDQDGDLARRIFAGTDIFLMPSRFEPCGLTQIYAMRYGSVPVAHAVGGLRDTIVDADERNLAQGTATGFLFQPDTADALVEAVNRSGQTYAKPPAWHQLMRSGMRRRFDWSRQARAYVRVYEQAIRKRRPPWRAP